MSIEDYEKGVQDGRIRAIEEMLILHKERINDVQSQIDGMTKRIVLQERLSFGILGALVIINSLDAVKSLT